MSGSKRLTLNLTDAELKAFDQLNIQKRMEVYHSIGHEDFVKMYGKDRVPPSNEHHGMEDYTDPTGRVWRSKKYYDDHVRVSQHYDRVEELNKRLDEPLPEIKYPDGNPKTQFGITKPRDTYTPPIPYLEYSLAHLQGALKYGPFNWRDDPVTMSTYLDAAISHILKFRDGNDRASDTDIHELGHAMTCLSIVIDGQHHKAITDDRWRPRDPEKHPNHGKILEAYIEDNQDRVKAIRLKWTNFQERYKAGEIDKYGEPIVKQKPEVEVDDDLQSVVDRERYEGEDK